MGSKFGGPETGTGLLCPALCVQAVGNRLNPKQVFGSGLGTRLCSVCALLLRMSVETLEVSTAVPQECCRQVVHLLGGFLENFTSVLSGLLVGKAIITRKKLCAFILSS